MEFVRKAIITAVISCMPIVIAALINIFVKVEVMAKSIDAVKGEFLRTLIVIDKRLERIEDKLYESD